MNNAQMSMKIIITEKQNREILKRLRRIEELRESIEFQTEVHSPCDRDFFPDAESYADFCIDEALCFFYKDEDCGDDEDDYYEEDEENDEDEDDYSDREEIEELMYKEFYDYLKELWETAECD